LDFAVCLFFLLQTPFLRRVKMIQTLAVLGLLLVIVTAALWQYAASHPSLKLHDLTKSRDSPPRVLLVFAHPDDEAMFFSPVLRWLLSQGVPVHWLCLTTGNYDGLGHVRREELMESAAYYDALTVEVLDDEAVAADGPRAQWDNERLDLLIARVAERTEATCVLTFDSHGVSGHPNHIAAYNAVRRLLQTRRNLCGLSIATLPLWAKYGGVFSALAHHFSARSLSVTTNPFDVFASFHGLAKHQSQLVWFRYLYISLAAYTFASPLVPM
jgi:N-acetylglucosaminylphosphatidylinositol deacetylase